MMEHRPMDPYEQQLLKVFDRYDHDNCGSLDRDGLIQLCQTLQLEEQGNVLIKNLLQEPDQSRATFTEFKEALVSLLGNIQNNHTQKNDENDTFNTSSPEREVSPKFVFGSKKYGRRSRPRVNDISAVTEQQQHNDNNILTNKTNFNVPLQKSNSQSDVAFVKKRKTNNKLKRCTSFPGNREFYEFKNASFDHYSYSSCDNTINSVENELVCTEDMLREAWRKLGVGEDGYLNQTELILVCDAIGLHKLADGVLRQLSGKLSLDYDRKISFQELLEALQQDDTWSEVLDTTTTSTISTPTATPAKNNLNLSCLSDEIFKYITLGPDGSGLINTDAIVEMWETAGITSPKLLLTDLGFKENLLNVTELAIVLDREIKSLTEIRADYNNPQIALLQASLTLYQTEIKCLKNILEQMQTEREKLKCDVSEANNRASLLAQEVDDNHARMEQSARNQVRLLEQRHADIMKELAEQYNGEKEHLVLLNKNLEQKIACLENEETKLRNDLQMTQNYTNTLETENHNLRSEINKLQKRELTLTKEISLLETEKEKRCEYEKEQLEPLLTKLSVLQLENAQLRDKNDEMLSEIEHLSSQVSALRPKISSTPMFKDYDQHHQLQSSTSSANSSNNSTDTVGVGAKRRNDESPSKELSVFGLGDASPRLGKVRKFHKQKDPFVSSESGYLEIDLDGVESLSVSGSDYDEIVVSLKAKIATLEQILTQHSIPLPNNKVQLNSSLDSENVSKENLKIMQLKSYCKDLEKTLVDVLRTVEMINFNVEDSCQNCAFFKDLQAKLNKLIVDNNNKANADESNEKKYANSKKLPITMLDASINTDQDDNETKRPDQTKYVEELENKCTELENCIELLRNEYEKCEDYWASKLDDERQMFEQEQSQNTEKLSELFAKIAEYETQFAQQETSLDSNRLPPIEETYNLEKQFTDLEQEYEEFRAIAEQEIFDKDSEITTLKERLIETSTADAAVQVDVAETVSLGSKMSQLSNHVIETTNLFSTETLPYNWSDASDRCVSELDSFETTPDMSWSNDNSNKETSLNANINNIENGENSLTNSLTDNQKLKMPSTAYNLLNGPSTSKHQQSNSATPCRPKRTRKYDRNPLLSSAQRLVNKRAVQEKSINNGDEKRKEMDEIPISHHNHGKGDDQVCMVSVSALNGLNGRVHQLERNCRYFQMVLKQHHLQAEQLLHRSWQQQKLEKNELQYHLKHNQEKLDIQTRICNDQLDRLARADTLVKELYVENSYLIANVHRLEQQIHMLANCNKSCSV